MAAPPPKPPRAPPPKPSSRTAPPPSLSAGQKEALTVQALGLLNEQVQARIVHYKAELETNAELDAITAEVVAQLKAMQASVVVAPGDRQSPAELEAAQVRTLTTLLQRVFGSADASSFAMANLKHVGKRVAKLFFESELHEKSKGDKEKTIHHPEQGVFYLLTRYKNRLRAELAGFDYQSAEVREATVDLLAKLERDLQVAFLSRRSPELNRVMHVFTEVLLAFLSEHLPPRSEQLARVVVRAAGSARQPNSVPYKILADRFPAFRAEWERHFMHQMVNYCGDELLERLSRDGEAYQDETLKFFSDPHIFSETASVLCDSLYDFLCLEGFLDLPVDWRVTLARS